MSTGFVFYDSSGNTILDLASYPVKYYGRYYVNQPPNADSVVSVPGLPLKSFARTENISTVPDESAFYSAVAETGVNYVKVISSGPFYPTGYMPYYVYVYGSF